MWSETNLESDSKSSAFLRFDQIRTENLWVFLPSFLLSSLKKKNKIAFF